MSKAKEIISINDFNDLTPGEQKTKNKFAALKTNTDHCFPECKLEAALIETKIDLEAGNFVEEGVDDHIKRIRCEQ